MKYLKYRAKIYVPYCGYSADYQWYVCIETGKLIHATYIHGYHAKIA